MEHLAFCEKTIAPFTLYGVCGLELELGCGRIYSICSVVNTNKNWTTIQGYVVGEDKKFDHFSDH